MDKICGLWYNIIKIKERSRYDKSRNRKTHFADIQWQMYDFYGIDSLPAADSNCASHEGLLKEMDAWMADQLRKSSLFEMISRDIIEMVDEEFNAHEIAGICYKMQMPRKMQVLR